MVSASYWRRKSRSFSAWQPRVPRWISDRNSVRTRRGPVDTRSSIRCPAHGALISDFYCKHMTRAWRFLSDVVEGGGRNVQHAYVLRVAMGVHSLDRASRTSAFGSKADNVCSF